MRPLVPERLLEIFQVISLQSPPLPHLPRYKFEITLISTIDASLFANIGPVTGINWYRPELTKILEVDASLLAITFRRRFRRFWPCRFRCVYSLCRARYSRQ